MNDWELDCIRWHGIVLVGDAKHWFPDWDDLPIDETCPEFECCCCDQFKDVKRTADTASEPLEPQ